MIDEDVTDLIDEDDDEISEDVTGYRAPYSEFDARVLEHLTDAQVKISAVTANEFLIESYLAATMLRNVCGDADAFVADQANTIRQNILVLATEIAKDPVELLIAVACTIDDPHARYQFVKRAADKLFDYETHTQMISQKETVHDLNASGIGQA